MCVAGRDEELLELNGKTYMLSLKVYETVKTDVAYVQDKSCVGLTRIKPIISCTRCARTASCSLMA